MCARDFHCTDGWTECRDCNGFGYLTMGGRRYRKRTGARNMALSTTKQPHETCCGIGEVPCGCIEFTEQQITEHYRRALLAVAS